MPLSVILRDGLDERAVQGALITTAGTVAETREVDLPGPIHPNATLEITEGPSVGLYRIQRGPALDRDGWRIMGLERVRQGC